MDRTKRLKWEPKPGIYQCVLPEGTVHIDVYIEGRTAETVALGPDDEIELWEKELRNLKRSEILQMGYLVPLFYFEKDDKDALIKIEVTEDPDNANIINNDMIFVKIQSFMSHKTAKAFVNHVQKITSMLTLYRFQNACKLLDTPHSYLSAIGNRIEELKTEEERQMYNGPIDSKRQNFLTPKIEKE